MRARQALNPGRIKLTFEDGSVKYATMERADNPVVEGHPLNPYTLLKDETCTMLGGDPETMVPDDAFQMLAALAASGGGGSGDVGDLEDTALEVGTIVNAGAGGIPTISVRLLMHRPRWCSSRRTLMAWCSSRTSRPRVSCTACGCFPPGAITRLPGRHPAPPIAPIRW